MERNMYLDKEKAVKAFMGTGEKNAAGEDLVTFLEKYDPHKYQNPCNTVDMAVFAYNESEKKVTKVLLIQRGNHPSIGWWALPGGFVEYRENLETAAARELQEETGIEHLSFEQLKTDVRLTSIICFHSSEVISCRSPIWEIPALLTNISGRKFFCESILKMSDISS